MTDPRDTMRWVWRGIALAALIIGWVFIAWQNHFHITAPLVFVCFGYLAVVATVYNLWRTGAAAVASSDDEADSTWAKPAGARGELEREKRTLIKAIKEAEFDHQMGKLSQRDVDDMIATYRARAVEVIKELERLDLGAAGSTREQILREVRARIELDARSQKKAGTEPNQAGKADGSNAGDARGKKQRSAKQAAASTEPAPMAAAGDAAPAIDKPGAAMAEDAAETAVAHPGDGASQVAAVAQAQAKAEAKVQAKAQRMIDDETMDADSTTTVEPKRDDPAKEATP